MMAWEILPASPVAHAGTVRFDPDAGGSSRVHIRMSYNPPAGWRGTWSPRLGVDPKSSMDEDLVRVKTLIETGRTPPDAVGPIVH